ncbi:MAG TPA: RNA pyrophosphohydrolase [Gammaproteobacteria bacterium]|nr:RNA pyrophosphohydrolase [Gammaproteobacteria bacterium]
MIDRDGFRPNVGIILSNAAGQLFWARRVGRRGWQFPQGGIQPHETPEEALYRELAEEVGLGPQSVELIAQSRSWLRYRLPKRYRRPDGEPACIGQKQRWFLLRFTGREEDVRLDASATPEFDHWRWVDYWQPLDEVIFFKRRVYAQVLDEFAPLLFPQGAPPRPPRQWR